MLAFLRNHHLASKVVDFMHLQAKPVWATGLKGIFQRLLLCPPKKPY